MDDKIKKSNYGIGVTADVPASDSFDGRFGFTAHYEGDEVTLHLTISEDQKYNFNVKKIDFLRALRHIFPDIISPQSLKYAEHALSRGVNPPSPPSGIGNLLNVILGGGGFPNTGAVSFDFGEYLPKPQPEEEEEED